MYGAYPYRSSMLINSEINIYKTNVRLSSEEFLKKRAEGALRPLKIRLRRD
jgi:hypothetical protein